MFHSDLETFAILRSAVEEAARAAGVPGYRLKSAQELMSSVSFKNEETYAALQAFVAAFRDWYGFHKHLETLGRHGDLDAHENQESTRRITQLNDARRALTERVGTES